MKKVVQACPKCGRWDYIKQLVPVAKIYCSSDCKYYGPPVKIEVELPEVN